MDTAKKLGFKKGDFVYTGAFPGVVVQFVNTTTPLCEVWGFEHEAGSVYAKDLKKLTKAEFLALAAQNGHTVLEPFTKEAKAVLA